MIVEYERVSSTQNWCWFGERFTLMKDKKVIAEFKLKHFGKIHMQEPKNYLKYEL